MEFAKTARNPSCALMTPTGPERDLWEFFRFVIPAFIDMSGYAQPHPWHDIPSGAHAPEEITVVVETPSSSRNKYELEKESGGFKLDRVLHSSVHYPGDYGFIPRTLFDDGDPLDVLLLLTEATFPGCVVAARPLGILRMRDGGKADDKVLAVPVGDAHRGEYFDIADLPQHLLREVEYFFATYKALEGKKVYLGGWEKSEVAMREITRSIELYADTYVRSTTP